MPSRRWHQKSHHGCAQCKARKVKCDETRPICRNCARQNKECQFASELVTVPPVYQPATPLTSQPQYGVLDIRPPSQHSQHQHQHQFQPSYHPQPPNAFSKHPMQALPLRQTQPISVALPPQQQQQMQITIPQEPLTPTSSDKSDGFKLPPLPTVDVHKLTEPVIQDLELMHHYTAVCYRTLAKGFGHGDVEACWRDGIPRQAYSHPFLLHGVLAISALHLSTLTGGPRKQTYLKLANQHHMSAVRLYRPVLGKVDKENCHALFAYASIAAVVAFALPPEIVPGQAPDPIRDVCGIFILLRGVMAVTFLAYEDIRTGPMSPLLGGIWQPRTDRLSRELEDALCLLAERCDAAAAAGAADHSEPPNARQSYRGAVDTLRQAWQHEQLNPEDTSLPITWPMFVNKGYIDALTMRRPAALAILAFWGVLVHTVPEHCFWAGDRGEVIIDAVAQQLGPEWHDVLRFPLEKKEPLQRHTPITPMSM